MSKKHGTRQGKMKRREKSKKRLGAFVLLTVFVIGIGTVAAPWRDLTGAKKVRAFLTPAPSPLPSPDHPSKEYIYAGGRLVATEAPGGVTLLAPANLSAVTLSNLPTPKVSISWSATSGADHYEIERTTKINIDYSPPTSVTGTTFTDENVSSVTAYIYRVRAVGSGGNVSPYSNFDLATAISFTDDTLQSQGTVVKAAHVNELRQAVDAVRFAANLLPANWGGSIGQNNTVIQATHIQNLRTFLDEARSALPPLGACTYTDNSIQSLQASYIKKEHIEQLRQCVK